MTTIGPVNREIEAQILLSGKSERLRSVTGGATHKSLIPVYKDENSLDIIMAALRLTGIETIVSQLGSSKDKHGLKLYRYLLKKGYSREVLVEPPNMQIGSAGALERFARLHRSSKPILSIVGDMHFDWSKIGDFIDFHKPGTISWFTSSTRISEMENYYGLVINGSGVVLGDTKINWNTPTDGMNLVTKGGLIIADRNLYLCLFDNYVKRTGKVDVDLYWDLLPFVEEMNRERVRTGKRSILNAYDSEGIILDIGTPELLDFTRTYLYENRHS